LYGKTIFYCVIYTVSLFDFFHRNPLTKMIHAM
jgi:hypothetical protein